MPTRKSPTNEPTAEQRTVRAALRNAGVMVDETSNNLVVVASKRIDDVVAAYIDAKARAAAATEEAQELRDLILAEITNEQTAPVLEAAGLGALELHALGGPALTVEFQRTNRFDKTAAMREDPDLIARHTKLSAPEPRLKLVTR